MIDDQILNLGILAAVGCFGLYLYLDEKKRKKEKMEFIFTNNRMLAKIEEAKDELNGLINTARTEGLHLIRETNKAHEISGDLTNTISMAEAENDASEKILRELNNSNRSAERASVRISDLVASAAELHRVMNVGGQPIVKQQTPTSVDEEPKDLCSTKNNVLNFVRSVK